MKCESHKCKAVMPGVRIMGTGHNGIPEPTEFIVTEIPPKWLVRWVENTDKNPGNPRLIILCPAHSA